MSTNIINKTAANPKPIEFEYMTISPDDAKELLGKNSHNRSLSEKVVSRYASDMIAEAWTLTHQPIAVGPDGELVDGQHRLAAIIRAGISVRIVLAIYRDPVHAEQARQKVDLGRARRGGDIFEIGGVVAKKGMGMRVYAITAALMAIEASEPWGGRTVAQVGQRYEKEKKGVDFAAKLPKKQFPAPVAGAFAFAHPVDPPAVETFVRLVSEKANLEPGTGAHFYVQAQAQGTFESRNAKIGSHRALTSHRVLRLVQMHMTGETGVLFRTSTKGVEYFAARRAEMGL